MTSDWLRRIFVILRDVEKSTCLRIQYGDRDGSRTSELEIRSRGALFNKYKPSFLFLFPFAFPLPFADSFSCFLSLSCFFFSSSFFACASKNPSGY